jgi:outer membrane protein assembly factor BamE (lipoprotein component of BamABCDE complex)
MARGAADWYAGGVKHASRLALVLCLAVLPGCFVARNTINEPLPPGRLAQLVPNQTTAAEVAELLGAPNEVVQLGHRSAWRYDYTVRKDAGLFLVVVMLMNRDTHTDRAWVFFDENEVLTHVGSTLAADSAEYILPWSELDH